MAGELPKEFVQPLCVRFQVGWQLPEDDRQFFAQPVNTGKETPKGVTHIPQFLHVGDEAGGFDGEAKVRRGLHRPVGEGVAGRQAIERVVDFHRVKVVGVENEPIGRLEVGRIEAPAPMRIDPTRSADAHHRRHRN
jgi:hypothetical protein